MDSCHDAGRACCEGDAEPLVLLVDEVVGRPYFVYVQSCRIPRNPEKMRATVRINIPVAYMYGLVSADDDDDDGEAEVERDAESVVKTTPSVTINTDRIWVNEYLLFETSHPRSMLITNPPLLKMIWTGMGI